MSTTSQAVRRPDGTKPWHLDAGEYTLREGHLWVMLPDGTGPSRLEGWDVTEHDDGTVTASPSILNPDSGWHGYLEHDTWRTV